MRHEFWRAALIAALLVVPLYLVVILWLGR